MTINTKTGFTYMVGIISMLPKNTEEQLPLCCPMVFDRDILNTLNMYGYMIK